jgi:hypothetical protein
MTTPNRTFRFGPVAVANAAGNLLNGTVTSLAGPVGVTLTQPVIYIKHIRAVNKTVGAATVSTYIGATGGSAAGTEVAWNAKSIPANDSVDVYFGGSGIRMDSADFLTGVASAAATITIEGEAEVGFS